MDLLTLVRRDTRAEFPRAASTKGGEHKGPCPLCGGQDRFCVWPDHPSGRARYWCRQCDKSGDLIQYLRDVHGLPFAEARKAAGLDLGHITAGQRIAATRPRPDTAPPLQPPPAPWQERARAFLRYAQEQLWSEAGFPAREYLRYERGLDEATIRRWGLGYHEQERYDDPRRWGLPGRRVYLSPGIVIPCQADGALWYVQIRRPHLPGGDKSDALLAYLDALPRWRPQAKYMAIRGGQGKALFGADALRGDLPLLVCEGEFDALLAWQELRDMVDVVTLGGASKGADIPGPWLLRLLPYRTILVAYDTDQAGHKGAAAWLARSRRARRVQVPWGDDLTSFWKAGGDLAAWLAFQLFEPLSRSCYNNNTSLTPY